MEMKVLWVGAIFLAGWLWFFLFVRQFLFNFTVASPLINRMRNTAENLIDKSAVRYTLISDVVCLIFIAVILFVILRFCATYLIVGFFAGGVVGLIFYIKKFTPKDRQMFDAFCGTYYQFVPDDELRTAMFNKKPSQMKIRLHAMELRTDFIPNFREQNADKDKKD